MVLNPNRLAHTPWPNCLWNGILSWDTPLQSYLFRAFSMGGSCKVRNSLLMQQFGQFMGSNAAFKQKPMGLLSEVPAKCILKSSRQFMLQLGPLY